MTAMSEISDAIRLWTVSNDGYGTVSLDGND